MTALFFGLVFIIITPPFHAPDEQVHFYRSYHISRLDFIIGKSENGVGGYLPVALERVVHATFVHPASPNYAQIKYDIYRTREAAKIEEKSELRFYNLSDTGLNPPISYLPQATGVAVGRILNSPPIAMMYIGRLFNLLAWVGICAWAVNLIPRKKWAVVFLGLLPMTLFQAASLSADVVAIGSLLLFFTYTLRLRESRKQLNYKQLGLLLTFAVLMTLGKQTMFIFLPLVLLIPSRLFISKRHAYVIKAGLVALPLLFMYGWLAMNRELSSVLDAHPNDAVPREQLKFVLTSPHSFINALWNSYFFAWGDHITKSFIGTFGWVNVPLSDGIVAIGYASMAFIMVVDDGQKKARAWLSRHQRIFVTSVALAYWIAINAALYVFNSPVGFKVIVGLQGRYFLPVALMLVPVVSGRWLKASRTAYNYIAILSPIFLLVASAYTIYVRYYINNV